MNRIARIAHSLGCVVCNPLATRRRKFHARLARDAGDIAFFDKLARDARRDRVHRLIGVITDSGTPPWVRQLSEQVTNDVLDGKSLITSMPPQHLQTGVIYGPTLLAMAEEMAHRDKPEVVTPEQYIGLQKAGKLDPDRLYIVKHSTAAVGRKTADDETIAAWDGRIMDGSE